MKRNIILLATAAAVTFTATTQSCVAVATSSVGLAILKRVLLGGITKGLNVFRDKNSFMGNQMIEAALPQQLRSVNNTLQSLGLGNLVQMEKQYIAQAAAYTVEIAEPILVNGVNSMTADDAARIVRGGRGAATQVLRERTSEQLMAAIAPRVDAKLNEFGIVKTLNQALSGSNMLGSILGGQNTTNVATGGISRFAAEQMVNGLFNIIQHDEVQNETAIQNSIGGLK